MEPGYYYLTQHDGHRSVLIVGEGNEYTYHAVEPITDEQVIAFLTRGK